MTDGGPAFPHPPMRFDSQQQAAEWKKYLSGMSLRQWYAGMALQGLIGQEDHPVDWIPLLAKTAFECADAMIAHQEGQAHG